MMSYELTMSQERNVRNKIDKKEQLFRTWQKVSFKLQLEPTGSFLCVESRELDRTQTRRHI